MPNSGHIGYHMPPPQPPPDLRSCTADGCTNKVWYEFDLQEDLRAFSYCSPECRDRHLLPIKRYELEEELAVMKQELERVATKDSPKMMQRQQSSNGQSSQRLPGQRHSSSTTSSTLSTSTSVKGIFYIPLKVFLKQPLIDTIAAGNKRAVTIEKKARKPSGLILFKKPYVNNKAEVVGVRLYVHHYSLACV